MQSSGELSGYGVLVTGGGTGIGKACAAEAARRGAMVMICGRNSVQPGFVATEIMEGIPRDSSVFESYLANTPLGGIGPDFRPFTGLTESELLARDTAG